ncbi:MAG: dTDP-4-dehydrorhamnose 3,5-epimerase family protein [bacterium]|nr:dTDP-4-dehydrorhamnose 3,5-epimerase family protein [bacterium]
MSDPNKPLFVQATNLDGPLIITPNVFRDHRGSYTMMFNKRLYGSIFEAYGITPKSFIEHDLSVSPLGSFIGIHGDPRTWKLVTCLFGRFLLAVVDCRKDKPTFGQSFQITLSEEDRTQVLIPAGFGNGHLVMSDRAGFFYWQSEYYRGAEHQFTYAWDEPQFNLTWPIDKPILSKRDKEVKHIGAS